MDHEELTAVLRHVDGSGDVEALPGIPEVYRRSAPGVGGDEPDEIPGTDLGFRPHVVEPQCTHVGLALLGFAHLRHHLEVMVGGPSDRFNLPRVESASLRLDARQALQLSLALLLSVLRTDLVAGGESRRSGSGSLLPFVGDGELLRLSKRLEVKVVKVVVALKLSRFALFGSLGLWLRNFGRWFRNLGRWFWNLPSPLLWLCLLRDTRSIGVIPSNRHTRDGFAVRYVILDVPQ